MKILLTGAPSSGKSTVVRLLEDEGFKVVHEMAERMILQGLHPAVDFFEFQFCTFWGIEREHKKLIPGELVFLDRSMGDAKAFFLERGMPIPEYLNEYKGDYHKIFLFDPVDYEDNGVRHEGRERQLALHEFFKQIYPNHVLVEDFGDPCKRVEFILEQLGIRKEQ